LIVRVLHLRAPAFHSLAAFRSVCPPTAHRTLTRRADPARFLLAKLVLRSPKWHRLRGGPRTLAAYARELGGSSGAVRAGLRQLCGRAPLGDHAWAVQDVPPAEWLDMIAADVAKYDADTAAPASAKKKAKSNIVDLTVDSDDEGGPPDEDVPMRPPPRPPTSSVVIKREQPEAGPSRIKLEPTTPPPTYLAAPTRVKIECEEPTLEGPVQTAARLENPERKQARQASPPHPPRNASFAQDDNVASLEDLLSVLSGSELKTLARDHKLKATGKVAYMVLTFGPAADD
jgi:hypothetical protein